MSIGYACKTIGVPKTSQRSCIKKNACESKLRELISHNLNSLNNIIDYNIQNNIKLFRISSDIIPFGSSPVNKIPWWDVFSSRLYAIGEKALNNKIRLSMHPGQYTVLNSTNKDVVKRAIKDLNYHNRLLDSLNLGPEHKIILHIGGTYNNKEKAVKRFVTNYGYLDERVKKRLVIENDNRSYNIYEVLMIADSLNIPVIFDNLHNNINFHDNKNDNNYWIKLCNKTWRKKDGRQKIHYSQQHKSKNKGSHSATIEIEKFLKFYNRLEIKDIDIMLEVKDKNLSSIKCINCTSVKDDITALKTEWEKYKYTIFEHSPLIYEKLEKMLDGITPVSFYKLLEEALKTPKTDKNIINTAKYIWNRFKNTTDKENKSFVKSIKKYKESSFSVGRLKSKIRKTAVKYKNDELQESYYFTL